MVLDGRSVDGRLPAITIRSINDEWQSSPLPGADPSARGAALIAFAALVSTP
jgi:hypothetical protein